MNPSERIAQYVIQTIKTGSRAEFRPEQSSGECDFYLTYAGGIRAALEVTVSTDRKSRLMLAKIAERGGCVRAINCRNSWLIYPRPSARFKLIFENADRYLSAIEAEGLNEVFAKPGQGNSAAVFQIMKDLEIVEGSVLQLRPPARIWVAGPVGNGSIVEAGDLQQAVEAEANKPDNKKKLAASSCTERHLFVYVESLNFEAWSALINRVIPEQPPALPAEITHVWAAANNTSGIVVWSAEPPSGWQDHGIIEVPAELLKF